MSTVKKGTLAKAAENDGGRKHLKPFRKRWTWKRERAAGKKAAQEHHP